MHNTLFFAATRGPWPAFLGVDELRSRPRARSDVERRSRPTAGHFTGVYSTRRRVRRATRQQQNARPASSRALRILVRDTTGHDREVLGNLTCSPPKIEASPQPAHGLGSAQARVLDSTRFKSGDVVARIPADLAQSSLGSPVASVQARHSARPLTSAQARQRSRALCPEPTFHCACFLSLPGLTHLGPALTLQIAARI